MTFTREEKEIFAQKKFESCFKHNYFFICGINDTYQFSNETDRNIYQDKVDEKLKDYYILSKFNGENFNSYPKETKIKIINITKNCFEQLGFRVNDKNLI